MQRERGSSTHKYWTIFQNKQLVGRKQSVAPKGVVKEPGCIPNPQILTTGNPKTESAELHISIVSMCSDPSHAYQIVILIMRDCAQT